MFEKRRLGWMVSVGAGLWMITLLMGMWISPQTMKLSWRAGSEVLWLGLGIVYAVLYGERIVRLPWKLLVIDVLVFMFGVVVVWALGLVVVSSLFTSIDPLGSVKEVANNSPILAGETLGGQVWEVMHEALSLWVVGMLPVVVRKLIGQRI